MKWERRGGEYTQEPEQAGKSSKIQFLQLMKKPISLYSRGNGSLTQGSMVSLFVVLLFRTIKKSYFEIQPNVLTGRLKTGRGVSCRYVRARSWAQRRARPSRAPAAPGGSERALPAALGRSEPEVSRRGLLGFPADLNCSLPPEERSSSFVLEGEMGSALGELSGFLVAGQTWKLWEVLY